MLIEQKTSYAYKLKYLENPTFDKVRGFAKPKLAVGCQVLRIVLNNCLFHPSTTSIFTSCRAFLLLQLMPTSKIRFDKPCNACG